MNKYVESNLIKELRDNSESAFEYLFKLYYSDLYSFSYSYVMNKDVAEDIIQDVFSKLWHMAKDIPDISSIKSYLYSSVKNSCFDYLKHLKVIDSNRKKLTEALIFSGTVGYETNDEIIKQVRDCLSKLSEQQRLILELKVVNGLKYKEIAEELKISEDTVHTHVKRAYKYFREYFPLLFYFIITFSQK